MIAEIDAHRDEIAALCRRYHVRRLELFGSAVAARTMTAARDLDFLVEFDPDTAGEYADVFFGLREDLERLFERPVDLVVGAAIRNPYFLESVKKSKTLLYAA